MLCSRPECQAINCYSSIIFLMRSPISSHSPERTQVDMPATGLTCILSPSSPSSIQTPGKTLKAPPASMVALSAPKLHPTPLFCFLLDTLHEPLSAFTLCSSHPRRQRQAVDPEGICLWVLSGGLQRTLERQVGKEQKQTAIPGLVSLPFTVNCRRPEKSNILSPLSPTQYVKLADWGCAIVHRLL